MSGNTGKITIQWEETRRYTAALTTDEARELFGLGGTGEDDLPYRIGKLATSRELCTLSMARLIAVHSYRVQEINGREVGDL